MTHDQIHLRDYIVTTEIGAFQVERGRQQRLRFNICVDLARTVAAGADDVDAILSYDVLTAAISQALASERYNLLETLAEEIARRILIHPQVALVALTVEKLDRVPGALGITIRRRRGQAAVVADPPAPVLVPVTGTRPDVVVVSPQMGREMVAARGDRALILVPDAAVPVRPATQDAVTKDPRALREIAALALDMAAWQWGAVLDLAVVATRTEMDWAIEQGAAVVWAPARMLAAAPDVAPAPKDAAQWLEMILKARYG